MLSNYNRYKKRPVSQKKPSTQQRDSTNHETGRIQPRAPMGNQALIAELQNTLEEETSSSNQQEESLTSKILKSGRKPTNKISQARPTIKHERPKAPRGRLFVDDSSSTTEEKHPEVTRLVEQQAQLNDRNHPYSNFIPLSELYSDKHERPKAPRGHLLVDDSSSTTEEKYPEVTRLVEQQAQLNDRNHTNFNHFPLPDVYPQDVTFKMNQEAKMKQHARFKDRNHTHFNHFPLPDVYPEDVTFKMNQEALNAPIIYPNLDLDQNYTDLPASIDEKPKADLPDNGRKIREKVQKKLKSDVIDKLKKVFPEPETEFSVIHEQFDAMVGSIEKPESSQEMLHFIDWCMRYIEGQQLYSTITLTKSQTRALNKALSTLKKLRGQIEGILEPTDKKQLFQPASVEKAKHNLLSAIQNYNNLFPRIKKAFTNSDGSEGHLFSVYRSGVAYLEPIMQSLKQQITGHDFLKECRDQTEFYASFSELQKLVIENTEKIKKELTEVKEWLRSVSCDIEIEGSDLHITYLLEGEPLSQVLDAFVDYQVALDEHFVMKTTITRPR